MGKHRGPSNNNDNNESEVHVAARSGDLLKLQSICNSNPLAVNSRDRHSRTPLHLAAWSGQTEIVSYLCKHKADVGAAAMDDTGAIHFASQKGHLEIVRTLLSCGVSAKTANRKGLTPLHYAVQGSHIELIKYLVRKGANLSAKTKSGQIPLDLANSEEIGLLLAECEQSLKKGNESKADAKADDSESKQPVNEQDMVSTADDFGNKAQEEDVDEREKRKLEEAAEENSSGHKRARVSLQHLIAEDDTPDVEEE